MKTPQPKAQSICQSAHGKVILAGEHAVVHGAPALACPLITLTTDISLKSHNEAGLRLTMNDSNTILIDAKYLCQKEHALTQCPPRYCYVLEGLFLLAHALKINSSSLSGLHVSWQSNIPMQVGLGSSAALAVALVKGYCAYYHLELHTDQIWQLSTQIEHLAHGQSSGLDPACALHQDIIEYRQGQVYPICPPTISITLINTGKSNSTTLECVKHTSPLFNNQSTLLAQFTSVTNQLKQGLLHSNTALIENAMKTNQKLLEIIGVVPNKTKALITTLNQHGIAAKICGAGSITGDHAGIVWALTQKPIDQLIAPYHANIICQHSPVNQTHEH